ncbi:MAG: alpha-galactosidase [Bacilli bacterium]
MITRNKDFFRLETRNTSYILRIDETKQIICEYYGAKIDEEEITAISEKWPYSYGSSIVYDKTLSKNKCLDLMSLEFSSVGKGNYNSPSIILKNKAGYVFDFRYVSAEIVEKISNYKILPMPHDIDNELIIYLKDETANITAELHYFVCEDSDSICRNVVLVNNSEEEIIIKKVMSMQLELINNDYEIINLYGGWINEGTKEFTPIKHGLYINDSKTGGSSNRHNPFFIVKEKKADYFNGDAYAFNLIYSGNHYSSVERTNYDKIIIQNGINEYCFEEKLKQNKTFITPISVLSFSNCGINGVSSNMHDFVNKHIIPKKLANLPKPIVINNWEATYFKFDEGKLLSIAKKAKKLGIEMFVLDDGWFSTRNNDSSGLGDYNVNLKKIHSGLKGLADKINDIGLKFGLWFEPEMVNEDSLLYKEHPDWIIRCVERTPSEGRNQFVLDLRKKVVRDYIVKNVDDILTDSNIEYVKWDCNRHISDLEALDELDTASFHNYVLGLYEVLKLITLRHSGVLFESCSSGGNRFDLGMLSYMHQTWASDDTDGHQRAIIQSGFSLGYPLSSISCHVSSNTSHQLLRKTPIETRFNLACFGVLGYEFDLNNLNSEEEKIVIDQINFYKKHRNLLQYGKFMQIETFDESNKMVWEVISKDRSEAIIGLFASLQEPNPKTTILKGYDFLPEAQYQVSVRKQNHNIKLFGGLINMISPIKLNEEGSIVNFISKHKLMEGEEETYIVKGSTLNAGAIKLKAEWAGVGYDENVRVIGDFGSRLYYIKKI